MCSPPTTLAAGPPPRWTTVPRRGPCVLTLGWVGWCCCPPLAATRMAHGWNQGLPSSASPGIRPSCWDKPMASSRSTNWLEPSGGWWPARATGSWCRRWSASMSGSRPRRRRHRGHCRLSVVAALTMARRRVARRRGGGRLALPGDGQPAGCQPRSRTASAARFTAGRPGKRLRIGRRSIIGGRTCQVRYGSARAWCRCRCVRSRR
jgi:hypothetical protein